MKDPKQARAWAVFLAVAIFAAGVAQAARPVAYPAKGQDSEEQRRDEGYCYGWTRTNTGIDLQTAEAAAGTSAELSGPAVGGGERVVGAAGGAVLGGIVTGGEAAGPGAVLGILTGGASARGKQRANQDSAQAQARIDLDTFNRSYAACMQARGYTVR